MFDVIALGELLIDFTPYGTSRDGRALFEQKPRRRSCKCTGGSVPPGSEDRLHRKKVGEDMHGHLLKDTLEECGINTSGLILDPDYFTTLAFVALENGERSFSFARKTGADTRLRK